MSRAAMTSDDDAHLASAGHMTAGRLRDRVVDARVAHGLSLSALQRLTRLSARTLRDIESGNPARRYGATTLARLDEALGWRPGTAYGLWKAEAAETQVEVMRRAIAEQMAALNDRVERMEEQPPWAAELIEACRLLTGEDRATLLELARRLAR